MSKIVPTVCIVGPLGRMIINQSDYNPEKHTLWDERDRKPAAPVSVPVAPTEPPTPPVESATAPVAPVEPVAPVAPASQVADQFDSMTKAQLLDFAQATFNVALDRALNKPELAAQVRALTAAKTAS